MPAPHWICCTVELGAWMPTDSRPGALLQRLPSRIARQSPIQSLCRCPVSTLSQYTSMGKPGERRMSGPSATITDLIEAQAARTPAALAIGAPGRESLTYCRLQEHVADTAEVLAAMGVGRNDRV